MYLASTSQCVPFLFVGLALLLASSVMACGLLAPSPPAPIPLPEPPPPAADSQPPEELPPVDEAASGEGWNLVEAFTGEGNETTPSFYVSGIKWRITWAVDAEYPENAILNLFVYPEGTHSILTKRISHSGDGASDTAYIYEGGRDYYIKVIGANLRSWTIRVEDYATKASLSPVEITRINYKGRGYFESRKMGYAIVEADEYVEIKNQGDCPQVIGGWRLKNITKGCPTFTFPVHMPCSCSWFDDYESCIEHCVPVSPCVLAPHQSIRVYTGEIREDDELYECDELYSEYRESGGFCFCYFPGDIWDNEVADIAALYNSRGEEVSRRSYIIPPENKVSTGE